jgi:nicotinic acid mononucleotide adenylyltransferase
MKSIALFGLSANPPTGLGGHQGIVRSLVLLDKFDEVWIVPVYQHMFASKRNQLLPFEQRLEMCTLSFSGESKEHCKVIISRLEQEATEYYSKKRGLEFRVGTIDLIDYIYHNRDDIKLTVTLGLDTFVDLARGKWKQADR